MNDAKFSFSATYEIQHCGSLLYLVNVDNYTAIVYSATDAKKQHTYITFNQMFVGELGYTLLFHISGLYYVWIGWRGPQLVISESPIVTYESPIYNNMSYPYAVDENANSYLFLNCVVMDAVDDPYHKYHTDKYIANYDAGQTWRSISALCINNQLYEFAYSPLADENYDRLLRLLVTDSHIEIIQNDKTRVLTKSVYIEIMREFGLEKGYRAIQMCDY